MMAGAIGNHAVMASTYVADSGVDRGAGGEGRGEGAAQRLPQPARAPEAAGPHRRGGARSRRCSPTRCGTLDMCPTSNGACAMVIAGDGDAQRLAARPAWIAAVASAHDQ